MDARRSRFGRLVALAALVGLVAAGCGSSSDDEEPAGGATDTTAAPAGGDGTGTTAAPGDGAEFVSLSGVPGVTDDSITFSALGTATASNPTGQCYLECFTEGINAYFAYRNSEGGVYGRELALAEPINDELGANQQRALEIISADDTLGVFVAPLIGNGYADFDDAGWPIFTYLTDPGQGALPNLFGSPPPSCVSCNRVDQVFMADAVGATEVGALGYSVESSATCAGGVVDSFAAYEGTVEATMAYENTSLPFGLPNGVAPEVTAMVDAGVDIVFACLDANGIKAVGEEMRRQGLDVPIVQNEGYDTDFIGANPEGYEGALVLSSIRPHEANNEGTDRALFEEWMAETGAETTPSIAAHGWVLARLAYEGLLAAGPEFSRQALVDGVNSIEDYTAGGLLSTQWDVGRQHETPTNEDPDTHGWQPYCYFILQVSDGQPELLAPSTPDEPGLCWESRASESIEPTPTNFTE